MTFSVKSTTLYCILLATFFLTSCGPFYSIPTNPPAQPPQPPQPPQQQNIISATQAYNNYYNKFGTTWIDLRNARNIQTNGRVPRSVNVEYTTFGEFAARLQRAGLSQNGRYVLYDNNGGMERSIINQMRQLGYPNVFYIQRGFNDWKRYNYPTEGAQPSRPQNIISATQAYNNYYNKSGTTWIDLRNARNIQANGRVPKSVNVAYTTFGEFAAKLQRSGFSKNGRYVLYDNNGGMERSIINQMRQLGYSNVFYIKKGFNDWKRYNYPTEGAQPSRPQNIISATQAYNNYYNKSGTTWIDLRSTRNIQANGRVPKSVNVEYTTFGEFTARLQRSGLRKNGRYVLYDNNGGMEKSIIAQMRQLGYTNVFYLKKGFNEWKRYKYPTERGSNSGVRPSPRGN